MNQIRLHGRIVKSKEGLNEGVLNSHETRNCFEDDKGIRHYPLFAASFLDSIDRYEMPVFDPNGINRLKAEYESPDVARTR